MASDKPFLTPNQITVYRFYLIFPLLGVWFLTQNVNVRFVIAILFALVFVGDCWDGVVAKKYNMTSTFGAYFDPIVDHISYFALCIMLLEAGYLSLWFLFIVLTRDLLVVFIKQLAASENQVISASIFAKVKTDLISVPLAGLYLVVVLPPFHQSIVILVVATYLLMLPVFFNPSQEHNRATRITVALLTILFFLRPNEITLAAYYEGLYMGLALIFCVGSGIGYFWSNREIIFRENT